MCLHAQELLRLKNIEHWSHCLTPRGAFAVDYSLHILHTFLHKGGESKEARAKSSMLEIGAAVLLGATSTLLGVVILAGSNSEIIRVFFKLLMGTVIFGAFVGMFFLPVLLSLVGPPPCLLRAAPTDDDLEEQAQANTPANRPSMTSSRIGTT